MGSIFVRNEENPLCGLLLHQIVSSNLILEWTDPGLLTTNGPVTSHERFDRRNELEFKIPRVFILSTKIPLSLAGRIPFVHRLLAILLAFVP